MAHFDLSCFTANIEMILLVKLPASTMCMLLGQSIEYFDNSSEAWARAESTFFIRVVV